MTNGALFDAYAIAFGLTLGAIAGLVYALRAKHAGHSDQADAERVECHCRLVAAPCDWAEHPEWGVS